MKPAEPELAESELAESELAEPELGRVRAGRVRAGRPGRPKLAEPVSRTTLGSRRWTPSGRTPVRRPRRSPRPGPLRPGPPRSPPRRRRTRPRPRAAPTADGTGQAGRAGPGHRGARGGPLPPQRVHPDQVPRRGRPGDPCLSSRRWPTAWSPAAPASLTSFRTADPPRFRGGSAARPVRPRVSQHGSARRSGPGRDSGAGARRAGPRPRRDGTHPLAPHRRSARHARSAPRTDPGLRSPSAPGSGR